MKTHAPVACLLLVVSASATAAEPVATPWLPLAPGVDSGGVHTFPEPFETATPRPTADISKFNRVYQIDLEKHGIQPDGTRPVETAKGINAALQEARTAGANRIVFPRGTYLIDETNPLLLNHRDTVVDLNGATFKINPNSLPKYQIFLIGPGAENLRLTNGTLEGDRDSHDFKTAPGTHEWGCGLKITSGRGLEVDHLICKNMTGDGVSSGVHGGRNRDELLQRILHSVDRKQIEPGAFSPEGAKQPGGGKCRTTEPLDLAKCTGAFEAGYTAGYMGFPFILHREYQAYFYDHERRFLSMAPCRQYRKVTVPAGARWLHLEFNQPEVSETPAHQGAPKAGTVIRITDFDSPVDVHFHHNEMVRNRRLGLAMCGGQRWVIEDNLFAETHGTGPAYGVDFEDGWEMVHDVIFRGNHFRDNQNGDLVICSGTELVVERNEFTGRFAMHGRPHNYTIRHNRFSGSTVTYSTRTGAASIHDNVYENTRLSIHFDTKPAADGLLRLPGKPVGTPPLRLVREKMTSMGEIGGTYFDFEDCDISRAQFIAGPDTSWFRLVGCTLTNSKVNYTAEGPPVTVSLKDVNGTLGESGPGVARKKSE